MFGNNIENISQDLEKKLELCIKTYGVKEDKYIFGDEKYIKLVEIILNISSKDIEDKLIYFNKTYIQEDYWKLFIEKNKLIYRTHDITNLVSELFYTLYYENKEKSFDLFVDYIRNRLGNDDNEQWFGMVFKDDDAEKYFLNKATDYVITQKNSLGELVNKSKTMDFENNSRTRHLYSIDIENIPIKFEDLYQMYAWLNIDKQSEFVHTLSSSFIQSLLSIIINIENKKSMQYHEYYNKIEKILDECQDDCFIMNKLLQSWHIDIKLNIYLLSNPKYTQFGLLNILKNNEKKNLVDSGCDYGLEWQELINKQTINIYFQHYNNHYFEKESIFNIINYLAYYAFRYENQSQYMLALEYILEKFESYYTQWYQKREYFFDTVINTLLDKQIDIILSNDMFDIKDYYLMSWYLVQLDKKEKIFDDNHNELILKITNTIQIHLEKSFLFNIDSRHFYIKDEYLDRINFSLLYKLSEDKNKWLRIIDIDETKKKINKENRHNIKQCIQFYFQILFIISKNNVDNKNLLDYIIDLAITFGIEDEYGIFDSHVDNTLYYDFLETLNHYNNEHFDKFIDKFLDKKSIKDILLVYEYTVFETRKDKIYKKINSLLEEDHDFFWLPDIAQTIYSALNIGLDDFANKLIKKYESYLVNKTGKKVDSDFKEVLCKKEILDIYRDKDDLLEDKFKKLNNLTIKFDENYVDKSKVIQCKEYENFIKALLFYEEEPVKTYKILNNFPNIGKNSMYLFNMLSAYFKAYENDENKIEKYKYILDEYEKDIENLIIKDKSLFNYSVLAFGYSQINENEKIINLYEKVPSYLKEQIKKELPQELNIFGTKTYVGHKLIIHVEDEYYQIYQIAWLKLNDIECNQDDFQSLFENKAPFTLKTGKSAGGVSGLLRTKDISLFEDKKIVGVFDFDKEGRENFHHLKKEGFWNKENEGNIQEGIYKKRNDCDCMFALLLPVPDRLKHLVSLEWENFISYIEIENLLPKNYLVENAFVEEKTNPGSSYLKIKSNVKNRLWKELFKLNKDDFIDFQPLFDIVIKLFNKSF
ncbi:MAG: Unknown protein [uncultured Sulfurovum sp.]|uniref:Uncharacterized protein n=1 Tax=uncultured Sulfurovum sp. TaxID=269237 RepID=A0A6S6SNJ5_9BACT|nr:MAG: Unknown protein [uncultured Sulfurovum sp.]